MTVLNRLPMTKHIVTLVGTALGYPTGLGSIPRVADPAPGAPAESKVLSQPPYAIVYSLWETTSGPPFSEPDADGDWTYQVTLASNRSDQLEWMRDRVRQLFLARAGGQFVTPFTVAGISVYDRVKRADTGLPTGDVDLPLTTDLQFGVLVSPT